MKRGKLLLGLIILISEILIVGTHWEEARAMQRVVYQTLWKYAPKPAGYVPPDRFAPRPRTDRPDAPVATDR